MAEYDDLGITASDAAVYALELDTGEVLRSTENHPFLTPTGYVPLELLTEGDYLVNADGGLTEILRIDYDGRETVYNMAVDRYHNFVTASGIVTHNCDALRYYCVMRTLPAKAENQAMTQSEWLRAAKNRALYGRKRR